ncbi:hypothetical protein JH271_10840 [Xanthomonas campestris pv. campestris]|uniref:hypothetical protein n=1 Tax=Xanthomonas campestris TaxID=339 RepID=UPI0023791954|nr:hypothetical protein [Xanthomonas campestris]WDK64795.1 hypothetical protein JH271_10840 [Xanthomonas campestris pv. campestris]WDK68840.1 hypothetical protein JH258_10860 [Xanthomonas campestris pv. campestris]WDK72710.1 hypothetical protein JH284_10040 [Xanthomonas campestris pv. campestris]WDK76915.1 hypothetical protein JH294_10860 [Xanthomonas campestris pv. campestris]WDL40543.1 hypothetical protein JH292_10640 [Xanthomonas campestris pv. campestris]
MFASAIVRRVAYVLVAVLFGALLGKPAYAATVQDDQGRIYALCMSEIPKITGGGNKVSRGQCVPFEQKPYVACYRQTYWVFSQAGATSGPELGPYERDDYCASGTTCAARPSEFGWLVDGLGAKCHTGCTYAYDPTAGGYSPSGTTCTSEESPEPKLDTDGDGVPDDEDAFPNDPNESKDTDGDGIGDNADIAPEDPTNGEDKEEGDEKDNQASGGGNCGAPPSCSGDAIACNTNWQVWRLRCQSTAVGSVTGDVTNCGAGINVTSPDPLANANILLQRKIACKQAEDGNQGDGQQPEWTKVNGMSQDPGKGGTDSDIPGINEVKVTADTLDQSGFGGGACVGFVAGSSGTGVSSGFTQSLATPPAFFCDYIGWLKLAIITGAAIYSVITISKGHA